MAAPLFPSTVNQLLTRSARRDPHKHALVFGDRSWTYAELDHAVGQIATRLRSLGLGHGDRVAAFGHNSDLYLVLYLACARAGLVHVPINFNAHGAELRFFQDQSDPAFAVVDESLEEAWSAAGGHTRLGMIATESLLDWASNSGQPTLEEAGAGDGDIVQFLYTSGTTSEPKGAVMTHRALVHEYISAITALDLSGSDVLLHALPLYHSAQMHVFLLPGLAVGATNHILHSADLDSILATVPAHGITAAFFPPTVWVGLLNHPRFATADLSSLRRAYYGASIMPVPVLAQLRERLPDVGFYNCFGQSEIGPLATVLRPEEHDARPDSIGKAVLFVDVRVVDEEMNEVPAGGVGELVYRSPQLCLGYWRKDQETDEAFAGGWFHSGDMARIDEEGYLFIVDRIKDVVNTGGVLVASRDVEDAVYQHPAVAEVAVIGVPDPKWIEAVVAVVVSKGDCTDEELIGFLRERLAKHKLPKTVHWVDALPKNPSGKILKRELRRTFGGAESAVGVVNPS